MAPFTPSQSQTYHISCSNRKVCNEVKPPLSWMRIFSPYPWPPVTTKKTVFPWFQPLIRWKLLCQCHICAPTPLVSPDRQIGNDNTCNSKKANINCTPLCILPAIAMQKTTNFKHQLKCSQSIGAEGMVNWAHSQADRSSRSIKR